MTRRRSTQQPLSTHRERLFLWRRRVLRFAWPASLTIVAVVSCHTMLTAQSGGAAPVVIVETSKGTFAFETYPREAPKTVAHVVSLVRSGFYDGQRVHRAIPGFLVQWGDPRSRDAGREADWGRGAEASSGKPIGAAEISKERPHLAGSVGVAHQGNPAGADSQIYVTLARRPDLDGYYTVFGQVVAGEDVPDKIERGDVIIKMYVRP